MVSAIAKRLGIIEESIDRKCTSKNSVEWQEKSEMQIVNFRQLGIVFKNMYCSKKDVIIDKNLKSQKFKHVVKIPFTFCFPSPNLSVL